MSLNVSAYYRDNEDKVELLDRLGEPSTLAGFESYRKDVFGSEFVRTQGCGTRGELVALESARSSPMRSTDRSLA